MYIAVLKQNLNMDMYGDIPEIFDSDNVIATFYNTDIAENFASVLLPLIDDKIDNELDLGDVDYFNYKKCVKLKEILLVNNEYLAKNLYHDILNELLDSCTYAIENHTGIVIELWGAHEEILHAFRRYLG